MTRRTPQARGSLRSGVARSFGILCCLACTAACGSSPGGGAGSGAAAVPPTASSGDPSASGSPAPPAPPSLPPVAAALVGLPDAVGTDTFAVWICAVPADTTEPLWVGRSLRLPLTPEDVVVRAADRLAAYFSTLSHGRYTVELRAGGTIELGHDESSEDCVHRAIEQTTDEDVEAVLAVADAEHAADAAGGWGTAGDRATCGQACPVGESRRAAYVGASDFHPDWGPVPALDLIEHEIGHTLGLPHSGSGAAGEAEYSSALDLMSNSAAPRDVDPDVLDAPDTIAIDRLALGWLPVRAVAVARDGVDEGTDAVLSPSTGTTGTRLLVLPVGEGVIVTVELLVPTGFDAHLPEAGVAVHLVDATDRPVSDRRQLTLGTPPFTDLAGPGDVLQAGPWSIEVRALDDGGGDPAAATATVHVVRLAAEVTEG